MVEKPSYSRIYRLKLGLNRLNNYCPNITTYHSEDMGPWSDEHRTTKKFKLGYHNWWLGATILCSRYIWFESLLSICSIYSIYFFLIQHSHILGHCHNAREIYILLASMAQKLVHFRCLLFLKKIIDIYLGKRQHKCIWFDVSKGISRLPQKLNVHICLVLPVMSCVFIDLYIPGFVYSLRPLASQLFIVGGLYMTSY